MSTIKSLGRAALRAAFVSLALTAGHAAAARAQVVLTDGWGIYTDRNGVTHYIPPGYMVQIGPNGEVFVMPIPAPPPPPPPNNGTQLAGSAAPPVRLALASFGLRAEAVSDAYPSYGTAPRLASEAGGRAGARFRALDAASVGVLHGFLAEPELERLQRDVREIHARLLELGAKGQMDTRSFGELRGAALRVRRAVADAVPAAARSGDPERRVAAALTLDGLVHQLEVLLPMLAEMERRASRTSAR